MWEDLKFQVKSMLSGKGITVLMFDYCLVLKHGLKTRKQILKDKKKFNPMTFAMEHENLMIGVNQNAFFTYELMNPSRMLKTPFYPKDNARLKTTYKDRKYPKKKHGEIRVIAVDVSMMASDSAFNDSTAISYIRAMQSKGYYKRQLVNMETNEGGHTEKQAIRIKQAFYDFDADFCVLDTRNAGIDTLVLFMRNRGVINWSIKQGS